MTRMTPDEIQDYMDEKRAKLARMFAQYTDAPDANVTDAPERSRTDSVGRDKDKGHTSRPRTRKYLKGCYPSRYDPTAGRRVPTRERYKVRQRDVTSRDVPDESERGKTIYVRTPTPSDVPEPASPDEVRNAWRARRKNPDIVTSAAGVFQRRYTTSKRGPVCG